MFPQSSVTRARVAVACMVAAFWLAAIVGAWRAWW